jgi:hypothetical protein
MRRRLIIAALLATLLGGYVVAPAWAATTASPQVPCSGIPAPC